MSIAVGYDVIGLEEVRDRLGNSGQVNRDIAKVFNEAAKIGTAVARAEAPKDSRRLVKAIKDDTIQFTGGDNFVEATFGVEPVDRFRRDPRGRFAKGGQFSGTSLYPVYVHEGTGLYGAFHRRITPRRAKAMVFVGRTGLVIAKSTKGQKAQPYVRRGYEAAQAYIQAHLDDMVEGLLD